MWIKLIEAIKSNNTAEAVELIEKIDLKDLSEKKDQYGYTALHCAFEMGNNEIVEMILKAAPESANVADKYGQTALHYAVRSGSKEIVEMILKAAPESANVADNYGRTALHYAAASNNKEVVEMILKAAPESANVADDYGYTALHRSGKIEIVEMILKAALESANVADDYGRTALHYAAMRGNNEVVEMIEKLATNANPQSDAKVKVQEKDCETLEKPVKSLVQQHQSEENAMSKQITTAEVNDATAEELNEEQTLAANFEGNDKAITTHQEKKVVYEKRLCLLVNHDENPIKETAYNKKRALEIEDFFTVEAVDARSLDLSNNPLDNIFCHRAISRKIDIFYNLSDLNLSNCNIDDSRWAKTISDFVRQSLNIKTLDLSNNMICGSPWDIELSQAIKSNTTLIDLNISNNQISKYSWQKPLSTALKENKTLKILNLLGNHISAEDLPLEEISCHIFIEPIKESITFNTEMYNRWLSTGSNVDESINQKQATLILGEAISETD